MASTVIPQDDSPDATPVTSANPEGNGTGDKRTPITLPPAPLEDMQTPFDGRPGQAKLQLDIDAGGKVVSAIVLESTFDRRTERDAVERIRETRFKPGTVDGHPVASRFTLEVRVAPALQTTPN